MNFKMSDASNKKVNEPNNSNVFVFLISSVPLCATKDPATH